MPNPYDMKTSDAGPSDLSGIEQHDVIGDVASPGIGGLGKDIGDSPAVEMNNSIAEVAAKAEELINQAKEYGIYNDRTSMRALLDIKKMANDVHETWMAKQKMGDQKPVEHKPMKLIEQKDEEKGGVAPWAPRGSRKGLKQNSMGGSIRDMKTGELEKSQEAQ